jgi:triple functional domain protein
LICKVEFQSCRFAFQNTFTNAEKLLAAAEELAQTGECSPNEIYAVARQLEQHVG